MKKLLTTFLKARVPLPVVATFSGVFLLLWALSKPWVLFEDYNGRFEVQHIESGDVRGTLISNIDPLPGTWSQFALLHGVEINTDANSRRVYIDRYVIWCPGFTSSRLVGPPSVFIPEGWIIGGDYEIMARNRKGHFVRIGVAKGLDLSKEL